MAAFDSVASSDNASRVSSRIWVILEKEQNEQNSAEKCRRERADTLQNQLRSAERAAGA